MGRKRELTKARLIRDLNIGQSLEIGIMFSIIGLGGLTTLIIKWKPVFEKMGIALPFIGMFALAFVLIGGFMLYVSLKDRYSIKHGDFAIFKDTVKRIETPEGTKHKRVYFEEYTKHCGFGAVDLNIDKVGIGDKYLLVKLPSSNFVALAYPCSVYNLGQDVKDFVKNATIALKRT